MQEKRLNLDIGSLKVSSVLINKKKANLSIVSLVSTSQRKTDPFKWPLTKNLELGAQTTQTASEKSSSLKSKLTVQSSPFGGLSEIEISNQ